MSNYTNTTTIGSHPIWDDPKNPQKNRFSSHQEAERHYDACALSNFQLNDLVGKYRAKFGELDAPPPAGPGWTPSGKKQEFTGGSIWKPASDNDGKAVVILASRYCSSGNSLIGPVKLYDKNGQVIETLRYTGCHQNGGRNHQRSGRTAAQLKALAPVYVTFSYNGAEEYFVVPDPTQRYD